MQNQKMSYTFPISNHRGVFRTLSNIEDGAFCENCQRCLAVNYFHKTLHL